MDLWSRSTCGDACMMGLIHRGLLPVRTNVLEWILSDRERLLEPSDGYVVSFVHFHEHRLTAPAHHFLLGLLDQYRIKL